MEDIANAEVVVPPSTVILPSMVSRAVDFSSSGRSLFSNP